jgi:hypothetical protein
LPVFQPSDYPRQLPCQQLKTVYNGEHVKKFTLR